MTFKYQIKVINGASYNQRLSYMTSDLPYNITSWITLKVEIKVTALSTGYIRYTKHVLPIFIIYICSICMLDIPAHIHLENT